MAQHFVNDTPSASHPCTPSQCLSQWHHFAELTRVTLTPWLSLHDEVLSEPSSPNVP